jgi:hypothetical protein
MVPTSTGFYTIGKKHASSVTSWHKRYFYDVSPNGSLNLKGRLSRAVSRDLSGEEIEETYQYDLYGRVSAVSLRALAFDDHVRTTTYRYDVQGQVVEIGYPTDGPGTIPAVYYAHTNSGRIAAIGTANDPTFYAAYDYNVDGSIKTEWLNRRTIRRDNTYDFQGRLAGIVDRGSGQQPWFAETVSYRDGSGQLKNGNIAQVFFTGSGVGLPHQYVYKYDEHDRLLSAKCAALTAQTTLPGNWDVEGDGGSIGYDANGNIMSISHRGTAEQYLYVAGTNRVAATGEPLRASIFSFEPGELSRFHGGTAQPSELKENEWYCKGNFRLITNDKFSGTQSLELDYLLASRLRASSRASRYVFKAWVKNFAHDPKKPDSRQTDVDRYCHRH